MVQELECSPSLFLLLPILQSFNRICTENMGNTQMRQCSLLWVSKGRIMMREWMIIQHFASLPLFILMAGDISRAAKVFSADQVYNNTFNYYTIEYYSHSFLDPSPFLSQLFGSNCSLLVHSTMDVSTLYIHWMHQ